MSKTFYIRVNCVGFHDYTVIADNQDEAVNQAEIAFQCECTEGEFGEFLSKGSLAHDDVIDKGVAS